MRIKLDENIPVSLVTELGQDVDSVPQEGLTAKADPDAWIGAQRSGRFLITQDLDFSEVRRYAPGTHQGLLLVRLKQPGRHAVSQRISPLFQECLLWPIAANERHSRHVFFERTIGVGAFAFVLH